MDQKPESDDEDLDVSIASLDIYMPLTERFTFKGEAYMGENANGSLGIGGFEIEEFGFWANIMFQATDKTSLNAGYSIAMVDNDEDLGDGDIEDNSQAFVNVWYKIYASMKLGAEWSYWETTYKGSSSVDNNRIMTSLVYGF